MFEPKLVISTHYLTQRQTLLGNMQGESTLFQLTTSHRGRPRASSWILEFRNFNSLPHTEVDFSSLHSIPNSFLFQLTTSHRGRQGGKTSLKLVKYFNSLPHTEVDEKWRCIGSTENISTHYLTQRQTFLKVQYRQETIFQLTTSHRGRRFL